MLTYEDPPPVVGTWALTTPSAVSDRNHVKTGPEVSSERHDLLDIIARLTQHGHQSYTIFDVASGLFGLYQTNRLIEDLDKAIELYTEAISISITEQAPSYPSSAVIYVDLAHALSTRFHKLKDPADLDSAIAYYHQAIDSLSTEQAPGSPSKAVIYVDLAHALHTRFHKLQRRTDFERQTDFDAMINCYQEAIEILPREQTTGSPSRASVCADLGDALYTRYNKLGVKADLDDAIGRYQDALPSSIYRSLAHRLPPEQFPLSHHSSAGGDPSAISDPFRVFTLNSLATALDQRYQSKGHLPDLKESIERYQEALPLVPAHHPLRGSCMFGLGNGLLRLGELQGSAAPLETLRDGREYVVKAAKHKSAPLEIQLRSSLRWIDAARCYKPKTLNAAYTLTMELLDKSVAVLCTVSSQHAHLALDELGQRAIRVPSDAAAHSIRQDQLPRAVEYLEHGRAIILRRLMGYRTAMDELKLVDSELADAFVSQSAELEQLVSRDELSTAHAGNGMSREDASEKYQEVSDAWNATIDNIRQLDNFETFLGPTPFVRLEAAADEGPIVIVNVSEQGSDAIILRRGGSPLSVSLPQATPSAVQSLADQLKRTTSPSQSEDESNRVLQQLLQEIWRIMVQPIVFVLENSLQRPPGSRIWWITTGVTCFLPLHAAGPYLPEQRNLPDCFVSSYTSTLSSLLRCRAGYQSRNRVPGSRLLVVAQSQAQGQARLPAVNYEVAVILRKAKTQITVCAGEECTKHTVLEALKKTNSVHFACHGEQHPTEPFQSHFVLPDSLTILDIIRNGLPDAELAFMSACHTAAGDARTPDEVINIAAALLFAGFRGVVGTMWGMLDVDGPIIAEAFYKYLFRNGPKAVNCGDAAKALVMGVRELRRRRVSLWRWINFVHYGI